jgi:YgiT-type zinc finger domain-containing protein
MKKRPRLTCARCGGECTAEATTFSADLGEGVLVVRHVPASVCGRCGERWMDDATARKLDALVASARKRGPLVEVLSLAS